jgi:hypothetical protein
MCRMRWLLCALLQLAVLRVDASKVHGVSKWVVHRHPCVVGGQSHCCISFSMPCQGHSLTKAQWQPDCPVSCQPMKVKSLDMLHVLYRRGMLGNPSTVGERRYSFANETLPIGVWQWTVDLSFFAQQRHKDNQR